MHIASKQSHNYYNMENKIYTSSSNLNHQYLVPFYPKFKYIKIFYLLINLRFAKIQFNSASYSPFKKFDILLNNFN